MLLSLIKYAGISTKTAAMKQKHLDKEQYLELAAKHSVTEVCSYLKNHTVYANVLGGLNEKQLHRDQLEELLNRYLESEVKKIFSFSKGNIRKILNYIFVRYTIEQIKAAMRIIESGEPNSGRTEDGFFAQKADANIAAIQAATSYRQLLEALEGTQYHSILEVYITRKIGIFQMEMALDAYFFQYVWKSKDKLLKGLDKAITTNSLGREIDMLNLIWVYRCKRYYRLESELIYAHIIPIHYKISKSELVELIGTPDVEAFLKKIKKTIYAKLFENKGKRSIEQNYAHIVLDIAKKNRRTHPFSIAALISYIHLIEIEIKNITSIIESVRYGLAPDEDVYTT